MALIPCPKCGKQISSLAVKCPHCGELLTQDAPNNNVVCPECGNEYDKSLNSCPNCGEPNKQVASSSTTKPIRSITEMNYERIFYINEDEFDEVKFVSTDFGLQDAKKLEGLEDYYNHIKPFVRPIHFTAKGNARFFLDYDEKDIIEALQEDERSPEDYGFGDSCKGVIVTIDKTETLKLPVSEDSDHAFLIEKEQYLRLCNAHSLQFKVFRENGKSFIIEGDEENTKLLIDCFRGLYNYVEDKTLFADSLVRLQQWADKEDAESKELEKQEEAKQAVAVQKDQSKGKRNSTIGIVSIVVGVILFIIGVSDFDDMYILVFLSIIAILVGVAFLIFGIMKKKGYSDVDAMNRVTEIFQNIHIK